ncbi:magnesium transporter [Roseibacillus ishigakijimensis]|uniref:Magnesium transporter MgtE n=1 Tax=Roseibacillus ishigakijimensis TaxID=454146 RepID=A0A934RKA5_9BACT|nr:magnesium transporter [Roseibacillus ishigakijimensis]MBK1833272.1 magnesium transporter [Roseibacillus ishigakijimensis]
MPERLRPALESRDGSAFLALAEELHYADLAAFYEQLEDEEERNFVVRTLSPVTFSDALAELPDSLREDAILRYQPSQQRELLNALSDDDRVDILQDMSGETQSQLLDLLSHEQKEITHTLLKYDEETAGGRMTTSIGLVTANLTVKQALDKLRDLQESAETLSRIFVIDERERPIGFVRLRDLAFASRDTPVRDIMFDVNETILATADQEEAAAMVRKYDLLALPVVDESHRLLGAITYDDAMEILEEESTEDMEKQAGIAGEQSEESYLRTHLWTHLRRRVGWLLVLGFLAIASGYVMIRFEPVLNSVFLLALFLPMVIATGGNTGGQASTMVIRAMSLGEIESKDAWEVAWKELRLGLSQGLILASALALTCLLVLPLLLPAEMKEIHLGRFTLAVSSALAVQVVASTLIGALLPIGARCIKLDPAVIAAPAITTIVDVSGMVIYFTTARLFLGL